MARIYPELTQYAKITLYDVASKILSQFDDKLAAYAADVFNRSGIDIRTSRRINELSPGLPNTDPEHQAGRLGLTLKVKDEPDIGVGMCIWSTG
jgi:NADH dehydrogenase